MSMPLWNSSPEVHGELRVPNSEFTAPRTGQRDGSAATALPARAIRRSSAVRRWVCSRTPAPTAEGRAKLNRRTLTPSPRTISRLNWLRRFKRLRFLPGFAPATPPAPERASASGFGDSSTPPSPLSTRDSSPLLLVNTGPHLANDVPNRRVGLSSTYRRERAPARHGPWRNVREVTSPWPAGYDSGQSWTTPRRRRRGAPMDEFYRIKRLPPYVFPIVNDLKSKARARGEDVIDLGMGNPDLGTPKRIVAKLVAAAQKPQNHRYSASRGITRLRRAMATWYRDRYGVELDHDSDVIATIGAK